ncbi:hypothetical protein KFL_007180010 [Klebsormidium nitens]|uniref:BZIP domain-containing protein n=1 Tax=Klebsormidium nitens TaxID=105231 RepID=A0A1Y1IJJ3_KLENI|nr:hypothetical protein KFL_007180010 [Klebsormidium nitens]|eukprot:GAQ91040.1 hypothetical protein KFL_007180010 [Klebsormidium nitens]
MLRSLCIAKGRRIGRTSRRPDRVGWLQLEVFTSKQPSESAERPLGGPKPEPVLFSPTSLPSAHAQRFLTSAGSEAALRKAQPLAERSSLEKSLAAGLDVRDMIDALVVERLREFTNLGTSAAPATWPAGGGASSSHEGGHGPGGSPTSDQEGGSLRPSHREWLTRLAAGRDTEGPPKKEPSRSRESDAEEGRKKRSRSRSRSSSPHEGQGGHERVGGNREAVRKYREKKKVEFASMQNQLAQLHKLCAAQDDQLRHKARLEEELVALWRQIAGLQEKVSRGHNLLVSELFAIKPPRSLT